MKLLGNQTRLKPRQIWKFGRGDFERAKDTLSSVDWEQLIDPTDVNQSLLTWENYFMNVMVSCTPKGILPKRKNLTWFKEHTTCNAEEEQRIQKVQVV